MVNDNNNDNKKRRTNDAQYNCSPSTYSCQSSFPKPQLAPFLCNSPSLYIGHDALWWNIILASSGHLAMLLPIFFCEPPLWQSMRPKKTQKTKTPNPTNQKNPQTNPNHLPTPQKKHLKNPNQTPNQKPINKIKVLDLGKHNLARTKTLVFYQHHSQSQSKTQHCNSFWEINSIPAKTRTIMYIELSLHSLGSLHIWCQCTSGQYKSLGTAGAVCP